MALKKKLKLGGKEIDVVEIPVTDSKEFFNEYKLEDGAQIRVKSVATSVLRLEGERNPDGTPIYLVLSGNVVNVMTGPDTREKKSCTLITYENTEVPENVEREFRELAGAWKSQRPATSFSFQLAMHPAYQRIIGLGKAALPLILAELEKDLDHWFWALRAISGEDPVPLESRGKLNEMANAWINWGRGKGYVW
jgi:hypothetical protein